MSLFSRRLYRRSSLRPPSFRALLAGVVLAFALQILLVAIVAAVGGAAASALSDWSGAGLAGPVFLGLLVAVACLSLVAGFTAARLAASRSGREGGFHGALAGALLLMGLTFLPGALPTALAPLSIQFFPSPMTEGSSPAPASSFPAELLSELPEDGRETVLAALAETARADEERAGLEALQAGGLSEAGAVERLRELRYALDAHTRESRRLADRSAHIEAIAATGGFALLFMSILFGALGGVATPRTDTFTKFHRALSRVDRPSAREFGRTRLFSWRRGFRSPARIGRGSKRRRFVPRNTGA